MFCRFGSLDERRPVAATAWSKRVWMRPVPGLTHLGSASMYVPLSLSSSRNSRTRAGQRVLLGERLEHVGVGRAAALRGALDDRELQLVEEDLLELVARTQREIAPGDPLAVQLELTKLQLHRAPELLEGRHVDEHAAHLHLREDARERHLDVAHQTHPSPSASRRGSRRARSERDSTASAAANVAARSTSSSSNVRLRPARLADACPRTALRSRRARAARAPSSRWGSRGREVRGRPACRTRGPRAARRGAREQDGDAFQVVADFRDRPGRRAAARGWRRRAPTRAASGTRGSGARSGRNGRCPVRSRGTRPTMSARIASLLVPCNAMPTSPRRRASATTRSRAPASSTQS